MGVVVGRAGARPRLTAYLRNITQSVRPARQTQSRNWSLLLHTGQD